ncbi:hypothetical protein RP726_16340 [Candidatus Methylospira mobilis]|uniref:hypothetical protein n=1 Tax=Candidatus Methylospira mobilis TaxID=1808979 RepID=UPI0028E392BB|nr:hypothetical protein [Candidatus Methylospira mobilis]WNV03982.1 hypothetical protein RP726_16340 [Candidatus Methylospira mobilis]
MNCLVCAIQVWVLLAIISLGWCSFIYADVQYSLNIGVDAASRDFLNRNQQRVAIAYASPLSEGNTVVVSLVFAPINDSTNIAFDYGWALYTSLDYPVAVFDVINMAVTQTNVGSQRAYRFDGKTIISDGTGVYGYITLYYNAPPESRPVTAGLAQYIYDTSQQPNKLAPINYHTLNRFETLSIPMSGSTVWVFVASNIAVGSVLPVNIMKPVSDSTSATSNNASTSAAAQTTMLQISRYLPVDLSVPSQIAIHFELDINAFAYDSTMTQ